ncbi:MAG: hypothetical protein HQK69_06700, partial [Desulfamplus sp.]|nr:hypothetical protein [Desulfamplus sp.]
MAAVTINENGSVDKIYPAHILPSDEGEPYQVIEPISTEALSIDCKEMVLALESELAKNNSLYKAEVGEEKALLIHVATETKLQSGCGIGSANIKADDSIKTDNNINNNSSIKVRKDIQDSVASLDELEELCRTSNIQVIGTAIQKRKIIDPKFVVGKGKLADLTISAIQKYATM